MKLKTTADGRNELKRGVEVALADRFESVTIETHDLESLLGDLDTAIAAVAERDRRIAELSDRLEKAKDARIAYLEATPGKESAAAWDALNRALGG